MKTDCPICGEQTITLRPDFYWDHGVEVEYISVDQDCFCFITNEQADELETRYDPEEAARQHQEPYVLVEM